MAGPIVSFTPGYNSSRAWATTWEVECQNAFLPSLSFQVKRINLPSSTNGVEVSIVISLNFAEITFLANPSLILLATSSGVVPLAYSFTDPSGNVIFTMRCSLFKKLFNHFRATKIIRWHKPYNQKVLLLFCLRVRGFKVQSLK